MYFRNFLSVRSEPSAGQRRGRSRVREMALAGYTNP